jgi:phospholipase A1
MRLIILAGLLWLAGPAQSQDYPLLPNHDITAEPLGAEAPAAATAEQAADGDDGRSAGLFGFQRQDIDTYSIVSVARGLSTHKPMYLMPITYSEDITGLNTEVVFQISAKQRLFARNLYFGYTQRSYWQLFDEERSRPFRETNYNPEVFYRWTPDPARYKHWGADIGVEHESNGKDLPDSRSWNRLYLAPFQAKGRHLFYAKLWYRLPEDRKRDANDPKGDDNPDIEDFYGYTELHFQRQFFGKHLGHLMARGNPATGKGAFSLTYSLPSPDGYAFYALSLWHGYGESLIDYNRQVTRIGIGVMLSR